jgi:beta-lactamase class A
MISRRRLIVAAGGIALSASGLSSARSATSLDTAALEKAIAGIETDSRGRLGVAVLDSGSGARFAQRGDERFAMCSTFKFLLAAAVLKRVDEGKEGLHRNVPVAKADIMSNSPVTERLAGGAASVATLCEAAITVSDNAAANLLIATVDGPSGLTEFARGIGDGVTRLDRTETSLNEAVAGDPRDTTSPDAMLDDLNRLLLGSALKDASRELLTGWLVACRTGAKRLRAGLPKDWRAGDKTGSGQNGTANDIGIFWPTAGAPILIASYLTECPLDADGKNAIHADVARAVVAAVRG